jgi:hypothetical protein
MKMAQTAKKLNTKVVTGKVRFSYANVFQPRAAVEGQEPKYSICILIPKTDKKTLAKINAAIKAAAEQGKERWGGRVPANLKTPLRDGDEERPDQPEFQGHYFLNANSKFKPGIVDRNLDPIMDQTEFYSGCYGRASINFYAYSVSGNRGVAAGLNNLQKLEDGEPLGGRVSAQSEFGGLDDEEDEDFLS